MSAPMEISFSAPPPPPDAASTAAASPLLEPAAAQMLPPVAAVSSSQPMQQTAAAAAVVAPSPADDKVLVSVEVLLHATSVARHEDVQVAVERMLEARSLSYVDGPVPIPADNSFLLENVKRIRISDTDEWVENHKVLLFWQVKPVVHVFQLSEDGPGEEPSEDDTLSSFNEWALPAKEFDGLWESLLYEVGLKQRLLRYAASALLFTERGVDTCLVSWNRIVLLHGPPGTGKTSLCKALAQKLSIRFKSRYSMCQLIEVNAHSLFSKWFSESGKLVAKLFQKIQEMVEEESNLVFVLIDEVESLAAARQAAISGSEPSDSIRVVNALLTQMDKLKSWPNVIILTTSNITTAIDIAFVDRADIKAYVGPPTLQARYEILRSCIQELLRVGILTYPQGSSVPCILNYSTLNEKKHCPEAAEPHGALHLSNLLYEASKLCEGLSGRSLRKLPFLAHASVTNPSCCDASTFLHTLIQTARREVLESRG
ncbi:thyroid receptor-interacting protein 13 [Zea mays]|uniref:Pachytene checkpoint protein 2 homolog n=1 Tax=Zea mays TaxID=4577 RepID=B4FEZ8_MAIZE|nr:thyroid receptor-interacting protein 13 [Zea mays]ACF80691.1 unknown [Zea mays]AQK44258.1 P-loop containing nucleoside triphosphate hydrolase superfamily protein [Zea mays]|eukprot:NP_001132019.1 thyroid receptor-interacting protein 13 [Zea mays]